MISVESMDKPVPTRSRPFSTTTVLALGLGLLVLLGIVAAASRAHHTPGGHAGVHQPPSGIGDYVFSIFALLLVATALFFLYLWFSERDLLVQKRQTQRGSIRLLILLIVFALIASVFARFHGFGLVHGHSSLGKVHFGSRATGLKKLANRKGEPRPPQFKWLPVFIATAAGMTLLGFIGVRAIRRSRSGLDVSFLLEQEFAELVDDTLADLYAEQDPRRAIIKAYARVERLFAAYGLPRDPSEAPIEYLTRVLGELRASGSALRRLTALFEWAKFSAHDVDTPMRDEAIASLVAVRDELRANRIEDEERKADAARTAA